MATLEITSFRADALEIRSLRVDKGSDKDQNTSSGFAVNAFLTRDQVDSNCQQHQCLPGADLKRYSVKPRNFIISNQVRPLDLFYWLDWNY